MEIIKGTTPTLKYTFSWVDVADITAAYLTIKDGTLTIEKDLTDANVGENYISWTLTQAETLSFDSSASVQLNWKLADGTRGASGKDLIVVTDNIKAVEI